MVAVALVSVVACAFPATARSAAMFESDDPVEFRVEAPISLLKKQRDEDPDWLEGRVYWRLDGAAEETTFDVQVKARGNFRRKKEICPFPSYWINFKKKQVDGTVFEGMDKIKVVAHCREGRREIDETVLKEYLTYRTYNILTEWSFRVRLANIEYSEPGKKGRGESEVAFLIEPVDSLAGRLHAKQNKERYILPSEYSAVDLCRADLFQFFIGCTDFSFFASLDECCHNAKAFGLKGVDADLVPVPYDFDLSGLVNPPYAKVNPRVPIKDITERYYRGVEVSDSVLRETIALYVGKKGEILELWRQADFLSEKDRKQALAYIESFYEILNDPNQVDELIVKRMRGIEKIEKQIMNREPEE